ncbi:autotransporter outer membrane beta-barrel domain-containing protein, partial [Aeromonas salmonicida]|uniref:autotransporter family protein n=1 Tax=Aeromonas salmonicida TaxID=645 RepID=UPI00259FB135
VDPEPPVEPEEPVLPELPPVDPEPPVKPEEPVLPELPPVDPEQPQEVYRPEIGSYLANRYGATNMFRHTRHERIGDFDYRGDSQSVWVRGDVDTFKAKTASSQIKLDTYSNSLQVGGHLWETDLSDYRVQLGWMVGKGKAKTQSSSLLTGYGASSSVEGYSYGAYGTLFSNSADQTGPYLDAWLSRGSFDNEVKGQDLDKEAYRSHLLTGSLEAGYTFHIGDTSEFAYMVEPQAQVIVNKYDMKEHREVNGTKVNTAKSTGVTTRVGARVFTRPHDKMNHRVRPFVEANWWHDDNDYAASFNGDKVSLDLNKNMFEGKLGAEIELSKDVKMWTSISAEVSPGSQSNVGGQIGIKY